MGELAGFLPQLIPIGEGRWEVQLEPPSGKLGREAALADALRTVDRWLADESLRSTHLHFDGKQYTMVAEGTRA